MTKNELKEFKEKVKNLSCKELHIIQWRLLHMLEDNIDTVSSRLNYLHDYINLFLYQIAQFKKNYRYFGHILEGKEND